MVTATPPRQLTQRELLGLVLDRAESSSASFRRAFEIASLACEASEEEVRELARELLTDLTIRSWIVLVRADEHGLDQPLPRSRYEMELAADANWGEPEAGRGARYVLTDRGREQLDRLLASLLVPAA